MPAGDRQDADGGGTPAVADGAAPALHAANESQREALLDRHYEKCKGRAGEAECGIVEGGIAMLEDDGQDLELHGTRPPAI